MARRLGGEFADGSCSRFARSARIFDRLHLDDFAKGLLLGWTDEAEKAKQQAREIYKRRGEFLVKLLNDELNLPATSPEGAFYTMLDVRSVGDDIETAEKFLQNRVITVPGVAFGTEAKGFLRLSFCNPEEKLTEGVRRMKEALSN